MKCIFKKLTVAAMLVEAVQSIVLASGRGPGTFGNGGKVLVHA